MGRPVRYVQDKENNCLTLDQVKDIYKKVEQESIVNVEVIKQEIEDDILDKDNIDNNKAVNQYQNTIINEFNRGNIIALQMEQWSILSNIVNYVHYDRNRRDVHNSNINAIDQKYHRKIYDRLKVRR